MRIRSILFIALIVSLGFFFYSTHHYSENAAGDSSSNSIRKSTLQLFPVPTLISDSDKDQNTIIYDLLISKSSELVFLYDTSVDMGSWSRYSPFDAKNLIIELKYNFDKERLDFNGSDLAGRKVNGYCSLTDRNNLKYSIKLIDPNYTLILETIHNPNIDEIDQPLFGTFTLESSIEEVFKEMGISSLKYGGGKFSLKGSYKHVKDKIEVSNLILHGSVIDMKILIDNSKTVSSAPIVEIVSSHDGGNFDKVFDGYNLSRKDILTWNDILTQVAKFNIKLSTKIKEVSYEGEKLKDVVIDLESNKGNEISIKDFKFKSSERSYFHTDGVISNKYFYPRYDGKFDIKNIPYKIFAKIFDLREEKSSNPISASGNLSVTPSVFSIRDLKLKEGKGEVVSENFRYVSLNNSDDTVIADISANQDVDYFQLASSFAKKYGDRLSQYGDRGTLGLDINIRKGSQDKRGMKFRYSNVRDIVSLSDIRYLNGGIYGSMKINPQAGNFDAKFKGKNVKVGDFHALLEEILLLPNVSYLNNYVNSLDKFEFEKLEGRGEIELNNVDYKDFQWAKCDMKFEHNNVSFKGCKAKIFGGNIDLFGKVSKKGGLSYNVSFRGNNIPLSEVWSRSGLQNKDFISAEGMCDIQGYVESKGLTSKSLDRNMIGSMAVRCKNGKLFKMNPEEGQSKEVVVTRGDFDIRKGRISSNRVFYKDGQDSGVLRFNYNFDSSTGELEEVQKKKT